MNSSCLHCVVCQLVEKWIAENQHVRCEQVILSLAEVVGELVGNFVEDDDQEVAINAVDRVIRQRAHNSELMRGAVAGHA